MRAIINNSAVIVAVVIAFFAILFTGIISLTNPVLPQKFMYALFIPNEMEEKQYVRQVTVYNNKSVEMTENKQYENTASEEVKMQSIEQSVSAEIIQFINGDELNEDKLKEYQKENISAGLKASIQLCLDFWKLDGSGSGSNAKTYWTFREKVKKDTNLKDSRLIKFLDEMCGPEANGTYTRQNKMKGLKK